MTKPTKWYIHSAELDHPGWASALESFLSLNPIALRTAKTPWSFGRSECNRVKSLTFTHANSTGSDQTGRMPRLICVFAGGTCHLVGFVMSRYISLI